MFIPQKCLFSGLNTQNPTPTKGTNDTPLTVICRPTLTKDTFFGMAVTTPQAGSHRDTLPALPPELLFAPTDWTRSIQLGSHFAQEPLAAMRQPTSYPIRNHCMVAALRTLLSICGLPDDHPWINMGSADTTAIRHALDASGIPLAELFHVNPFQGDGDTPKGMSLNALRYLLDQAGFSTRLLPTGFPRTTEDWKTIYQQLKENGYDIKDDLNELLETRRNIDVTGRLMNETIRMSQQAVRALHHGYPILVMRQHVVILYQPPGSDKVLVSDALKGGWQEFPHQDDRKLREFMSDIPGRLAQVLVLTGTK